MVLAETVSSVGTGKQFYFLLRLAITPYYPKLHLHLNLFIVYNCLLSFIILYIRYTNAQSYGMGGIERPNVPCFKLSTCFLIDDMWYGLTLCKIEGQVLS